MLAKTLVWSAGILTALLAVLSVLPLIPSGEWYVRAWAFPRLQLACLALLPLALLGVHRWQVKAFKTQLTVLLVLLATVIYQLSHVVPFSPLWPVETPAATGPTPHTIKVLTANINYHNDRHEEMLAMILEQDADLVLLLEVDDRWAKALQELNEHYEHQLGEIRGEGLGMVLWSRFAFTEQDVKHLVSERRPSVFVTLDVPDVASPVRYAGLHPTPPALEDRIARNDQSEGARRDSRVRDAELVLVAREVRRDRDQRWIVTGDFNDVAWSRTTRMFKDLSGLTDPRVGRRMLNTYHAQRPLLRYPIDHLFVSEGLELVEMSRVTAPGSDHFALVGTLAVVAAQMQEVDPSSELKEDAREIVEEGERDASRREVQADDR